LKTARDRRDHPDAGEAGRCHGVFSFRNITLVDFDKVGFPGIGDLAFVWQKAIYSVDPDESLNECLMWQQSYDRKGNWMSGSEDWNRA
jgi:hypothetical protein